jgi:UDPglucose 6-dehydrogenase
MKVSVIGLGKLGAPMAAVYAAKGHRVFGADLNARFVDAINQGQPPVFEPGLGEWLRKGGDRLSATLDVQAAVAASDATFLIVPTPSGPDGRFSTRFVVDAARDIGAAIGSKPGYHRVVLTSTVMPGDTAGQLLPELERASKRRCPSGFGLLYSPEFISLGSVIRDMLRPDLVLIGESDPASGEWLAGFALGICENNPRVARMGFANAELAKLALNTYVTTKVSYANMLAEICEALPGGDVDAVTGAVGLDSRVGVKYLRGGVGYGGPCFPRDNIALGALARSLGVAAPIPAAADAVNDAQVARYIALTEALASTAGGSIGILGLAYKPGTNVIERSQGLELARQLAHRGHHLRCFDPWAADAARAVLPGSVSFASTAPDCAASSDVVVVTLPATEFNLAPQDLARPGRRRAVLDCWRLLDRQAVAAVCDYVALGTADCARALSQSTGHETQARRAA